MTTYNTGLPVPSADARDRYDNGQTFDELINGMLDRYTNRIGRSVLSMRGMENQFNLFLQNAGYEVPVPYAAGILVERNTQIIEKDGELYRAKPGVIPFTTTGVWATDSANLVAVGDAVLRQQLAGDGGADMVFMEGRSVGDSLRDRINIKDGKFGAIGDGTYHPLSEKYANLTQAQVKYSFVTSLTQSIDWAAIQKALNVGAGKTVFGPKGGYVLTDGLVPKSNSCLEGDGGTTPFYQGFPIVSVASDGGFDLYMIGTGPKTKEIYGVTDMQPSGGVRVDPTTGLSYSMTNFYNTDATTTAPATARKVSVGIDVSNANGVRLKNFRIVPAFQDANGILHGYNDSTNLNWADDWGIGVLLKDAHDCVLDGVRAVGHWREAGLGIVATLDQDVNGLNSSCERNKIINGQFSGHAGIMVRGGDVYKVTAVAANTVSIAWHDSIPFPAANGKLLISFGGATGASYTYTGWVQVADKVVFSGMTPNPVDFGVTTSSAVLAGNSFGLQGTEIHGNYITGLEHASGRRCTDPALAAPFATPSKCLEVTGVPAANLRVIANTIMTQEDCFAHWHNASNMFFSLNYWEAKTAVGIAGKGARFVSIGSYLDASYAPYMYGTVHTVTFNDQMKEQADMYPSFARSPAVTRFGVDAGLFTLKTVSSTEHQTDLGEDNACVFQGLRFENLKFMDGDGGHLMSMTNIGNIQYGKRARFNTMTEDRWIFYRLDGTTEFFKLDGTIATPAAIFDGTVRPLTDNSRSLGNASFRWSTVFAGTGTINTSDGTMKDVRGLLNAAELNAWGNVHAKIFKMLEAIDEKGAADARLHAGFIAQEVAEAFLAEGLDPARYALWCEDPVYENAFEIQEVTRQVTVERMVRTWETKVIDGQPVRVAVDTVQSTSVTEPKQVVDQDGNPVVNDRGDPVMFNVPVMETVEVPVEVEKQVGTRLGLRYSQCSVMGEAYLRTRLEQQQAVLDDLQTRLAALEP